MLKISLRKKINIVLISFVLFVFGFPNMSFAVWLGPSENPPGSNMPAPINAGDMMQVKDGTLWLGGDNYGDNSGDFGLLVEQGNVGIGTTDPSSLLDVESTTTSTDIIAEFLTSGVFDEVNGKIGIQVGRSYDYPDRLMEFGYGSLTTFGRSPFFYVSLGDNAGALQERFRITHAGNVGIGTNNPASLFEVNAGIGGDAEFRIIADTDNVGSEDDNPFITFLQDGTTVTGFIGLEGSAGTRSPNTLANSFVLGSERGIAMHLITNDVVRLTIESGGDIGIGTTNPGSALVIDDGTGVVLDINSGVISAVGNPLGDDDAMSRLYADGRYAMDYEALPAGISGQTLRHDGSIWATSTLLYNNGTNIGIGTTNPKAPLEVNAMSDAYILRSNYQDTSGSRNIWDGTTEFYTPLHLTSYRDNSPIIKVSARDGHSAFIESMSNINSDGSYYMLGQNIYFDNMLDSTTRTASKFSGAVGILMRADYLGVGGDIDFIRTTSRDGSNNHGVSETTAVSMRIDASGNVGIGTTDPGVKLEVNGGVHVGTARNSNALTSSFSFHDPDGGSYAYTQLVEEGWSGGHALLWNAYKYDHSGDGGLDLTGKIRYANDVGGNSSGAGMIQFNGNGGTIKFHISPLSTGKDTNVVWDTPKMTILRNGNVGIGTTNPQTRFHSVGAQASFTNGQGQDEGIFLIPENSQDGNGGGRMFFKENSNNGYGFSIGYNGTTANAILNWPTDSFVISRHNNNSTGEIAMVIERATGEIGIGTASPDAELHVEGDVKITGELELGGADVAEEFITNRIYPAGTVLIMDDKGYKSARASNKEYDTSVIGVVSDNASLIMGKVRSDKKAIVALVGVVKVKVNNSNGQIKKGDLLTTSGIYGEAMLANDPQIGTVIGKALENLYGESGEVMALVNLQ